MTRMLTHYLDEMARDTAARSFPRITDPLEHNAGGCGCGSGMQPSGGCCAVCGPGGKAMSGGNASAARLLMGLFADKSDLIARVATGIGAVGREGAVSGDAVAASIEAKGDELRGGCTPYMDAVRDCLCMVELPSQRVVVPAGGAVQLLIQPQAGWFFAFYFDVNVNRPGTPPANPCVPPCEYQIERPTVRGCPPSPCIPPPATGTARTIPMSANFLAAPQTCSGCGRPFIAVIPNLANGTPLEINLSGLAQNDVAQAIVRGFCFDTRICC